MNNDIDFHNIESRFKSLLELKSGNDSKAIIQAIIDNDLPGKLKYYQSEKLKIDTYEKFDKYRKELIDFFNEVYEVITAPGVKKLCDWFEMLDISIKIDNTKLENIKRILIQDYNDLGRQVQSILENIILLEPGDSLFKRIKAYIRTNIAKRILVFESSRSSLEKELPGFIKELDFMLLGISKIKELYYNNVQDFYTTNINLKDNTDFKPNYDQEAEYYYSIITKIVENKDWLSTDQTKIRLSDIAQKTSEIINDIKESIKSLKKLEAHNKTDNNLKLIYTKYERQLEFKTGDNIYDRIESDLKDIWIPLIDNYISINSYFQNYNLQKLNKLEGLKKHWEQLPCKGDLEIYCLNVKNLLTTNPITIVRLIF